MKQWLKTSLLIVIFLALTAAWVFLGGSFKLQQVVYYGLITIDRCEINIGIEPGTNLIFVSLSQMEKIIAQDKRIESVTVRRRYPDALEVLVREHSARYLLNAGTVWGISQNGYAIPLGETSQMASMPLISCPSGFEPKPYRKVNLPQITRAVDVLNSLAARDPEILDEISEIDAQSDSSMALYLAESGIRVQMNGIDKENFARLNVILDNLGEKESDAVEIDLRFQDQGIVRFKENSNQKRS